MLLFKSFGFNMAFGITVVKHGVHVPILNANMIFESCGSANYDLNLVLFFTQTCHVIWNKVHESY